MQHSKGITLIEILVVVVILSFVALALYGTLSKGIQIWQRVRQPLLSEDIAIFLEKLTHDVRNASTLKKSSFLGKIDSLEFVTFVKSEELGGSTPGKVRYTFNTQEQAFYREQKDYSCLYREVSGALQKVLGKVKAATFQYYYYDKEKKEYIFKEEWLKEEFPLAVRILFVMDTSGDHNSFVRTITFPLGH